MGMRAGQMNTTLLIDTGVREHMDTLPPAREISASMLFRWTILAATTSAAEWKKECKARPELNKVTEFLRDRLTAILK